MQNVAPRVSGMLISNEMHLAKSTELTPHVPMLLTCNSVHCKHCQLDVLCYKKPRLDKNGITTPGLS